MSSTKIVIENFRNIGYNPELSTDKRTTFLLNRSNNKDYYGDLCIILGKNNSGKSNVLSALNLLSSPLNYTENDIPRNLKEGFTKNKGLKPKVYIYGKEKNIEPFDINEPIVQIKTYLKQLYNLWNSNSQINNIYTYSSQRNNKNNDLFNLNIPNIINIIQANIQEQRAFITDNNWKEKIISLNIFNQYAAKENLSNISDCKKYILKVLTAINILDQNSGIPYCIFSNEKSNIIFNWINNTKIKDKLTDYINKIEKYENEILKFDYDVIFMQNITYKQDDFSLSNIEEIENNTFFKTLFKILNININDFLDIDAKEPNWGRYLNWLNKQIKNINEEFNKIFSLFNKKVKYSFSFSGDTKLKFDLYLKSEEKDEVIYQNYDQQSDGFKWFFNFFFTFWSKLHNNDKQKIILLDEPGNSLSSISLMELRNFLKKIAYKYAVTFVLTTHRYEWIDLDYLEELRIIEKPLSEVEIHNNFIFEIEKQEVWINSLIRSVETNFFSISSSENIEEFDDTKNYILVEGISDYLYLTGIKLYLLNSKKEDEQFIKKLQHIYFLPINGVEIGEENMEKKFQLYQKILKAKKFLFIVDNDNAGKNFKKTINNDILVKTLSDIVDKKDIKTIESFISEKDIKDFELVDNDNKKHANNSYEFKRALINNKVSKETISNLTSLLEAIIDEVY